MADSIGILAYGSLIDDPGPELEKFIVGSIETATPFNVEYGRKSSTRGGAPTLTITADGCKVNARILILDSKVDLQYAKDMLYRRELRLNDLSKVYNEPARESAKMRIRKLSNFENIGDVLYADLPGNIDSVTSKLLAELAIGSARNVRTKPGMDGITYLMNNIANGIVTPLTEQYQQQILLQTNTTSMKAALELLVPSKAF